MYLFRFNHRQTTLSSYATLYDITNLSYRECPQSNKINYDSLPIKSESSTQP